MFFLLLLCLGILWISEKEVLKAVEKNDLEVAAIEEKHLKSPLKTGDSMGKRWFLVQRFFQLPKRSFPTAFPKTFTGLFHSLFHCRLATNFWVLYGVMLMENRYLCSMNEKLNVEEMNRLDVAAFKESEKLPLIMVLDNVRSLHNVGSVLRTADAFRLEGVWLCGITATPPHPEIHKTALGAEDSVDWRYFATTEEAVAELHACGYCVVAIEQCHGSVMLTDFRIDRTRRYAFIMGNEVKGVQQSVVNRSDFVIEIPQFGTKHSMNVSVSAGIVMWEVLRQWQ